MIEKKATEARQGEIGHGVRYILARSLIFTIVAMAGVYLFFA